MPDALAITSGVVMVVVVISYFTQVVSGSSTPNPATWVIWFVVMAMNTATYYFVMRQNVWQVLTPTTITIGVLVILLYSFAKGKLGPIGRVEILVLGLSAFVGFFWWSTKDSATSNLLMQIILLISFVPTVIGLLRKELKEKPLPWMLGVLSYCFLSSSILCSCDWTWLQLAYPFVNGIIGNGSVVVAMQISKQSRT